jgi:hypothetical protein
VTVDSIKLAIFVLLQRPHTGSWLDSTLKRHPKMAPTTFISLVSTTVSTFTETYPNSVVTGYIESEYLSTSIAPALRLPTNSITGIALPMRRSFATTTTRSSTILTTVTHFFAVDTITVTLGEQKCDFEYLANTDSSRDHPGQYIRIV